MPAGSRVRANNVYGTVSDNPLLIGATSFTSLGLSLLPAISGQHAVIVLDPKRVIGPDPEIVIVTSHLALGTTATITRGAYGTTARAHPQGTAWAHVPVGPDDYVAVVTSGTRPTDPYLGQMIYETDTDTYTGRGAGPVWQSVLTLGQWLSWTPTLGQGVTTNVTKTVNYARYIKIGRTIIASFYLTVTGTGTATSSINITLPVNINATQAAFPTMIGGGFVLLDTSANTYYNGSCDNAATANQIFAKPLTSIGLGSQFLGIGSSAGTTLFNSAIAVGDTITGTVIYEAVS